MEEPLNPPLLSLSPDDPEPVLTQEEQELKDKKDKVVKCKAIVLSEMGFHPITTDTKRFSQLQKRVLIEKVKLLFEEQNEIVDEKFNEICQDILFSTEKQDYTTYPVFKR